MANQVASEVIEIIEDDNSVGEECWDLLEVICSFAFQDLNPASTSSAHFQASSEFNVEDYVNEGGDGILAAPSFFADGDGILAAPNHTIINSNEKPQDPGQSCSLLPSSPTEDSPLYMLATSDGALSNKYVMDDLTTMSGSHVVLPSIQENVGASSIAFAGTTADMCFVKNPQSQFLGQPSTCSSPEIIDLTQIDDMDETDDVPMELAPIPELDALTDMDQIDNVPMLLPRKNVTLALDLDGTLIHSARYDHGADFSFPMRRGEEEYTVYVKKRPHVDAFLEEAAHMFELVVFTASTSSYANQVINALDPENRLISRRFFRESCVSVDGNYQKDLTIIEADLAKVAIVDNTPEVFQQQVNNGIAIKSWSSGRYDISLLELIPFLETIADADDVRPIIADKFAN
ncbi:CTD small phosphatase-like protein 2 [Triticum aestivum]|uniref:CTD small phosphatase-like protein 2 n=1 Tax=Triticum aestivum TaxID=4565 RepID=UPI001D01A4A3|nr:CTD small phosphatase-like protein 2 [Triticum aestivum]